MNSRITQALIISAIFIVAAEAWFVVRNLQEYEKEAGFFIPMPSPGGFHKLPESESVDTAPIPVAISSGIFRKVPFTAQAPSANWDNIIFQQGCEEASMLMAMLWVQDRGFISISDAEKAIVSISNFSQKNYGEFRDTSIEDTAVIMRAYFDYEKVEVKSNITTEDIKTELVNGNLVIVPVNGQKIGNSFYTPPGPVQHMLVVRGYDPDKKEFITNDPGTRRGEGFRYGEEVLEAALQDYITGYKEPIGKVNKSMIVVAR